MALIDCPECGGTVSDQAPSCIHCGFPLPSEDTTSTSFPESNSVDPGEQTPSPKTQDVGPVDERRRITDEQLALIPDDPRSAVKRAHIVRITHANRLMDEGRFTAEEWAQFDKASRAEMRRDLDELSGMGEGEMPPPPTPSPAASGGPIAALVLGIIGGLFGLAMSTILLVASPFTEDTTVTAALAAIGVVLSIMGIVGGAIAKANPQTAAILLLVSGIGGFLVMFLFWLVPGVLLVVGGIMAWRSAKASAV